jgi:chemotaxis protein MotB
MSGAPYVAVQALDPDEIIAEAMDGDSWEPTSEPSASASQAAEEDTALTGNKKRFVQLYERIQEHIQVNQLESLLKAVKEDDDSILIRMTDSALFDSAKADIKPDALVILNDICAIIDEYNDMIETIWVQGHTDSIPISSDKYRDNTDLSLMRAANVTRYMRNIMSIDPGKVVAEGFGEYRPVDTNDTKAGQANNRRVDFVIQAKVEE